MVENKIQLQHPEAGKTAPRIDREKYDAFHAALLEVIPPDDEGVPFGELTTRIEQVNPKLNQFGSVGWYMVSVKLHMEAVGEIERVPKSKPQRVRRIVT